MQNILQLFVRTGGEGRGGEGREGEGRGGRGEERGEERGGKEKEEEGGEGRGGEGRGGEGRRGSIETDKCHQPKILYTIPTSCVHRKKFIHNEQLNLNSPAPFPC